MQIEHAPVRELALVKPPALVGVEPILGEAVELVPEEGGLGDVQGHLSSLPFCGWAEPDRAPSHRRGSGALARNPPSAAAAAQVQSPAARGTRRVRAYRRSLGR